MRKLVMVSLLFVLMAVSTGCSTIVNLLPGFATATAGTNPLKGQSYYKAWTQADWEQASPDEQKQIAKAIVCEDGAAAPGDNSALSFIAALNLLLAEDDSRTIQQAIDIMNSGNIEIRASFAPQ